jgi:hypothetical protein
MRASLVDYAIPSDFARGLTVNCSHKKPVPEGQKCDVAVVLGYALHR